MYIYIYTYIHIVCIYNANTVDKSTVGRWTFTNWKFEIGQAELRFGDLAPQQQQSPDHAETC